MKQMIIHGDNLEVMQGMESDSVDLVFTSPPYEAARTYGTSGGKLPWSDNTAMGHPPKWATGGAMSHRTGSGSRVNQWGHSIESGATQVDSGSVVRSKGKRPSHRTKNFLRHNDGGHDRDICAIANPGNVIRCNVGGGQMGSKLCHENEAPFPESLAEFFIRSFCPPDGTVMDPHSGSGTTAAVAQRLGRKFIAIDVRESQTDLTQRRLGEDASRQQELAL